MYEEDNYADSGSFGDGFAEGMARRNGNEPRPEPDELWHQETARGNTGFDNDEYVGGFLGGFYGGEKAALTGRKQSKR